MIIIFTKDIMTFLGFLKIHSVENCQQEHLDLQQRLQTLSINDRITDLPDIPMELRKEIWYVSLLFFICTCQYYKLHRGKPQN